MFTVCLAVLTMTFACEVLSRLLQMGWVWRTRDHRTRVSWSRDRTLTWPDPTVVLSPSQDSKGDSFCFAIPNTLCAEPHAPSLVGRCFWSSPLLGWELPLFPGRWVRSCLIDLYIPTPLTAGAAPKWHTIGAHRTSVEMSLPRAGCVGQHMLAVLCPPFWWPPSTAPSCHCLGKQHGLFFFWSMF